MSQTMTDPRLIKPRWKRTLLNRFCRRQASYLWGDKRMVTPVLVPWVWGDGRQIIALRPIITRQSHYVIVGDSAWTLDDRPEYSTFREHLKDGIYDLIEDLFGRCGCVDCSEYEEDEVQPPDDIVFTQWPTPCLAIGCEWWELGILSRLAKPGEGP